VSVANPRQTHSFAKSLGNLAKTDSIDARMLLKYAEKMSPRPTRVLSEAMEELQALNRRRSQLTQMRAQEKNHAKAPTLSTEERQSIKETKKFINKQIRKIDELRGKLLEKDPELQSIYQALDDQDGIARQGACVLMGEILKYQH
jgi:transposase